jgi:NAD(P)H-flavin reductase
MNEHSFSVQLKSKDHVTNISMSEKSGEAVLLEGVLGELEGLEVLDETVLRIAGTNGTLMIDLTEDELRDMLFKKKGGEE